MPTAPPPTREAKLDPGVFWFRYHKEILAIVLVAIVGALGYLGYRFYIERRDAGAAAALAKAKTSADYEQVIAKHASSPAGASAYLLLGQAQRNEKKFAESNKTLEAFVQKQPKHELVPAARIAMAANNESLGRIDDALAKYQEVATNSPQSFEAPYAMISQVRLLKAKNQTEQARQLCEKILTEHSESRWAGEAMRQLRELTPKEPATPPPGAPAQGALPPGVPAPPGAARSTSSSPQNAPAPPPMLARPSAPPAPSTKPK